MNARASHAIVAALTLALWAAPSAADEEPQPETTKVVIVPVTDLPEGDIPPPPPEADAPTGVPAWTQPATISVTDAGEMTRMRRIKKPSVRVSKKSVLAAKHAERVEKVKLVAIAPAEPSIDALYPPSAEATDLDGPSSQKLSCGDRESVLPMRWESLAKTDDGDARLSVHDLWFDAKTCAVGPGPEKTLPLKAIAWENGKPWLYAMRGRDGVTLVMPRMNDLNSESMVGAPVSMRGDFTRVTMPIGRWGSGSIVAQLDAFPGESSENGGDRPIEVGIEIVQTMSEKAPTLLVRTKRANPVPTDEGRD
jgi:hypothetical protein